MPSITVELDDLLPRFKEFLALAAAGTEIIITEGRQPRGRLVPPAPAKPRVPGAFKGLITISDDFDAPLPDDFWSGGSS